MLPSSNVDGHGNRHEAIVRPFLGKEDSHVLGTEQKASSPCAVGGYCFKISNELATLHLKQAPRELRRVCCRTTHGDSHSLAHGNFCRLEGHRHVRYSLETVARKHREISSQTGPSLTILCNMQLITKRRPSLLLGGTRSNMHLDCRKPPALQSGDSLYPAAFRSFPDLYSDRERPVTQRVWCFRRDNLSSSRRMNSRLASPTLPYFQVTSIDRQIKRKKPSKQCG